MHHDSIVEVSLLSPTVNVVHSVRKTTRPEVLLGVVADQLLGVALAAAVRRALQSFRTGSTFRIV